MSKMTASELSQAMVDLVHASGWVGGVVVVLTEPHGDDLSIVVGSNATERHVVHGILALATAHTGTGTPEHMTTLGPTPPGRMQ